MLGWNEEMLLGLAPTPWQPLSARRQIREPMSTRLRFVVLGVIALLHFLALLALMMKVDKRAPPPQDAIVVDFIDIAPVLPEAQPAPLPNETITIRMPKPVPRREEAPAPKPERAVPKSAEDVPMPVVETRKPTQTRPEPKLQLYNPDGSLRVPDDMLDELDKKFGDKRTFSWQIPHLDDAKKYFDRNPALVYEETRFEKYYTPHGDALTLLLKKAVEATTKEIKVKVPGTSGSYMVCTVSILAMGGGCGVLTNGADWNGPQDDPNTLNPEEDRQCKAWWDRIVAAKTQDAWRETKKLYEKSCRKPLARTPSG